jgi:lipid A ethanolaminephosphotransferase
MTEKAYSTHAMIAGVSLFTAAFCNFGLFTGALETYGSNAASLLFIGSLFCCITCLFVLVLAAVCHRGTVKPVLIAFLLVSSVLAYFTGKYGTVFDYRMIANVLETNRAEAGDLFNVQLLAYVIVLGVLPSLAIYRLRLRHPDWKAETLGRLKLAGGALATVALMQAGFGGHYAGLMRDHGELVGKVTPTYALYSTAKLAVRSVPRAAVAQAHVSVGADARLPPSDVHRELVIMVVGETARADHWSLNGYARDTTPQLAREDLINFPDFWSCATSTSLSVPCMFSRLGRAGFDPDRAKREDNALDILSRAGVSVLWRDNNSDSKGVADRVTYEDFKTPDKNPVCDEVECRDEGMLHGLQAFIDRQRGDVMIVLHQMGNHGPAYYKRYPKAFERFKPVCATNDLGSCSAQEIRNAYDNVITYTDDFLTKVIALLKHNDGQFETAMLYVADHGESLGEYGVFLHGLPYALAPDAQKHVPAVLWLGRAMKHDVLLSETQAQRTKRWSHDNVFATLLGLFEIGSAAYDPKLDLVVRPAEEPAAGG